MEQIQTQQQTRAGGPRGDYGLGADADPLSATVLSGPYAERLPVAGLSVGEIRARMGARLDIAPRAIAVVDGHDVSETTVLRAGQTLTFMTRAGEKG